MHFIGMIGFAVGLAAFAGQMSGQPILYGWRHVGSMALPTALVTMIYGFGFFLVSRGEANHGEGS